VKPEVDNIVFASSYKKPDAEAQFEEIKRILEANPEERILAWVWNEHSTKQIAWVSGITSQEWRAVNNLYRADIVKQKDELDVTEIIHTSTFSFATPIKQKELDRIKKDYDKKSRNYLSNDYYCFTIISSWVLVFTGVLGFVALGLKLPVVSLIAIIGFGITTVAKVVGMIKSVNA
jgi:hypothetical protein